MDSVYRDRPLEVFSPPMGLVPPNTLITLSMYPTCLLWLLSVPTLPSSLPSSTALFWWHQAYPSPIPSTRTSCPLPSPSSDLNPPHSTLVKKTSLRLSAFCVPCQPDVPGIYNVNFSSGCCHPECCPPEVWGAAGERRFRLGTWLLGKVHWTAPEAPWRKMRASGSPTPSSRGLTTLNYLLPVRPGPSHDTWISSESGTKHSHMRPSTPVRATVHP